MNCTCGHTFTDADRLEHRLACGDSTKREDVERVMGESKAVLFVTSPPYHVGKEYEKDQTWPDFLALVETALGSAAGFAEPGAYFFVNFSENTNKPIVMGEVYRRLFVDELGWQWHSERYWKRPCGQPLYVWKTPRPRGESESIWTFRAPDGSPEIQRAFDISAAKIWETKNSPGVDGHSAVMHTDIASKALRIYSDLGDVVLDPFMGSGTTLVACENLGRVGVGLELSPAYVAVALQRMKDLGLDPQLAEGK